MSEIHQLSATQLAAAIARGEIGSRVALDHFLARIETIGKPINSVVAMDIENARARADAADAAIAAGENWGPLHGVPMTVKDTYETAGLPTVVGEPKLKDYRSTDDAVAISRLRAAGAVIFGKTNTPRLAQDVQTFNPVYGTTNNPWNDKRTSGGSSGGAAAGLAAGFTPLELGSDLAGSIRTPSSWCGVYGHKTSYGLIPMRGHIPGPPGTRGEPDLCVSGPMARHPGDLALALEILAGPDAIDASVWRTQLPAPKPTTLADFKVAVLFDHAFCPISKAVKARLEDAVEAARRAGASVTKIDDLPGGFEKSYETYDRLLNGLVGASIPDKLYNKAKRGATFMGLMGKTDAGTMGGLPNAPPPAIATGQRPTKPATSCASSGIRCSPITTCYCCRAFAYRRFRTTRKAPCYHARSTWTARPTAIPTCSDGSRRPPSPACPPPAPRSASPTTACRSACRSWPTTATI